VQPGLFLHRHGSLHVLVLFRLNFDDKLDLGSAQLRFGSCRLDLDCGELDLMVCWFNLCTKTLDLVEKE
jgi:hypothetical protein